MIKSIVGQIKNHPNLSLIIGSLITLLFIYINQKTLYQLDFQINNFIKNFRTPNLNHFMLFITYLAQWQNITLAAIFSSIILFLLRNYYYLTSLLISILGGEIFVWTIKNTIDRPRPPLIDALITENSYSFPSGHSFIAVSFYGLIIFFLFKGIKKNYQKSLLVFLGLTLIISIGISRIYLGVHWPSDVLASYFSGLIWLSVITSTTHIKKIFNSKIIHPPRFKNKTITIISVISIIIYIFNVYIFYKNHLF